MKPKPTVCRKRIAESKEDVLQCEGGCDLWFHRYCAGISVYHIEELSNSSEPFACYQRSQLAVRKQLRSEVAHLKVEISKLSEQLAKLSSTASLRDETTVSPSNTNNSGTYSNVQTYAAALKQGGNLPHVLTCILNPPLAQSTWWLRQT